jgi:glutaminyl-tRNA synthetase
MPNAKLEPALATDAADARFQFVRTGYFIKDSKHEGVYNRIVSLKDSYPKK